MANGMRVFERRGGGTDAAGAGRDGDDGSRVGTKGGLRAAALLVLALACLGATPALAQTTIVSNLGQSSGGILNIGVSMAQAFTTGATQYRLTGVRVRMTASGAYTVSIWTTDANGHPDTKVVDLAAPGNLDSTDVDRFTAPANTMLDTDTTYAVVLSRAPGLNITNSSAEDAGAVQGWSIADALLQRSSTTWNTFTGGAARIAIEGRLPVLTTCTSNDLSGRQQMWSASLTVGERTAAGEVLEYGYTDVRTGIGSLSDTDFTGESTYTVTTLSHAAVDEAIGQLTVKLTPQLSDAEVADLRLHVCGVTLNFSDAIRTESPLRDTFRWPHSNFDWSSLTTAQVAISRSPPPPPTTCAAPTIPAGHTEIWSASLTPGDIVWDANPDGNVTVEHGYSLDQVFSNAGTLSDTSFDIGASDYTVSRLAVSTIGTPPGALNIALNQRLSAAHRTSLKLHVCGATYDFSDASEAGTNNNYHWSDAGLDWSALTSAQVRISRSEALACPANNIPSALEVWSGTVTVGELSAGGVVRGYGFDRIGADAGGALSDTNFQLDANSYTVAELLQRVGTGVDGQLVMDLDRSFSSSERSNLRLHICGEVFPLSDATHTAGSHSYLWRDAGLDWSGETTREAALSKIRDVSFPSNTLTKSVDEDAKAGAVLLTAAEVNAVDSTGAPRYSVEGRDAGLVRINSSTGQVTLRADANPGAHSCRCLEFTVRATSRTHSTLSATLDARVTFVGVSATSTAPGNLIISWNNIGDDSSGTCVRYWPRRSRTCIPGKPCPRPSNVIYEADPSYSSQTGSRQVAQGQSSVTVTGLWPDHNYNVAVRTVEGSTDTRCQYSDDSDTIITAWTDGHGQRGLSGPRAAISVPTDSPNDAYVLRGNATPRNGTLRARVYIDYPTEDWVSGGAEGVLIEIAGKWDGDTEPVFTKRWGLIAQQATRHGRRWYKDYDIDLGDARNGTRGRHGTIRLRLTAVQGHRNGQLLEGSQEPTTLGSARTLTYRVCEGQCSSNATAPEPLTAEFVDAPTTHDGEDFDFEIAFSEPLKDSFSYSSWTDHLFLSGATVTRAARIVKTGAERNKRWQISVSPDSASEAVSMTISPPAACTDASALCTEAGNPLSQGLATFIIAEAQTLPATQPDELTATLTGVPTEHDGSTPIRFELAFSEEPQRIGYQAMRNSVVQVTQGDSRITPKTKRATKGSDQRWNITVRPQGHADISIAIVAPSSCSAAGAVCTADGTALSNAPTATVLGPPGLSVADATVQEGGGDLEFAVTLSRPPGSGVSVDYATSNGTATAGSDYTPTSGTLTFAAGETEKTVSVPVLDDLHDEGSETLTLTLSNVQGNAYLGDADATGTIENTDAMPQAWLARFGRTVAEQVIEAVEGRFAAPAPGAQVTVAGQRIGLSGAGSGEASLAEEAEEEEARSRLEAMSRWLRGTEDAGERRAGFDARAVTPREILTGSSFSVTGETGAGGLVSFWGRGAVSRFDGRERGADGGPGLTLDGEVVSAMMGADWRRDPGSGSGAWTAGLLMSRSVGEGGYRRADMSGTVESTLTGLFPYASAAVSDRVTVWGIAGLGEGDLTLTPVTSSSNEDEADDADEEDEADEAPSSALRTGMDLAMVAVGLRGVAVQAPADGGFELAVKTDAMAVRTGSDAVSGPGGNLAAAEADVTRLRLGLEGTVRGLRAGSGALVPTLEIGLRHDGGDAETGAGLDLGGGLSWSDPESGLAASFRGRGLLTHDSDGFRDRGLSGSFAWAPGQESGRGPSVTLTQSVGGAASGGADALFGHRHLGGLAAGDDGPGGDDLANRRLELRMGYGFGAMENRFTATPELGLGLSNGSRDYTLGWKLGLARAGSTALDLRLEATRREAANDNPQHGIGFRLTARW